MSPAADQLGAIVLTPLNVAWTVQAVGLVAAAAYVVGAGPALPTALVATLLWLLCCTAVAQLLGWLAELVRTLRHGPGALRAAAAAGAAAVLVLVTTGRAGAVLDRLPTTVVYVGSVATDPWRYVVTQLVVRWPCCSPWWRRCRWPTPW